MLRAAAALLVATLAACSSAPAPAPTPVPEPEPAPEPAPTRTALTPDPEPAARIAGAYSRPHTVMVVCDKPDWCEQEVEDRMVVKDVGGDAVEVEVELVQANAHTCTFDGRLAYTLADDGSRRWMYQSAEGSDGHPCAVSLSLEGETLALKSEGCRDYCGARAYLESEFPARP